MNVQIMNNCKIVSPFSLHSVWLLLPTIIHCSDCLSDLAMFKLSLFSIHLPLVSQFLKFVTCSYNLLSPATKID